MNPNLSDQRTTSYILTVRHACHMAIQSSYRSITLGTDSREGNILAASKSLLRQRCYSLVAVLMSLDLGWPTAQHLTYKSYVTPAIWRLEDAIGPLHLARIGRKDISSAQTNDTSDSGATAS